MSGVAKHPLLVIAGIGNGTGTGASTARLFAKSGYRVALIARNPQHLENLAKQINESGGEAAAFPVSSYAASALEEAFSAITKRWPKSETTLRAAVWNAAHGIWKPFLEITDEELSETLDVDIRASFAFSRYVIRTYKENELDENGKRGTLIFTGATASLRGNTTTSAFAAGKFGVRALTQSLNKEFGKDNIHVAHAIIDGAIMTDRLRERVKDASREQNDNIRLHPDSIAKAYWYLANQDRSAWTWELDLRPAHEKW